MTDKYKLDRGAFEMNMIVSELAMTNASSIEIKDEINEVFSRKTERSVSEECLTCPHAKSKQGYEYRPLQNDTVVTGIVSCTAPGGRCNRVTAKPIMWEEEDMTKGESMISRAISNGALEVASHSMDKFVYDRLHAWPKSSSELTSYDGPSPFPEYRSDKDAFIKPEQYVPPRSKDEPSTEGAGDW